MKRFGLLFAGALAFFALSACSDDENDLVNNEPEYDDAYYAAQASISSDDSSFSITSEGGTVSFKTEGGQVTVNVNCGTDWTAENHATDIVDAVSDSSAGILTLTASQNTIEEELTGEVILMTAKEGITFATITVIQNAYGAPEIKVETNEWHAPAVGELTTEISVDSTDDWDVENGCEWLTVEKNAASITLTAEENEETEERTAEIVLTCTDGIRSDSETITVTQDGKAYISLSTELLEIYANEGTYSVTVDSNFDWDYSYDSSNGWFTLDKNGEELTVSVNENEAGEDREGTVTVTAGDGAENIAEIGLTITQSGFQLGAFVLEYTVTTSNTTVMLPLGDSSYPLLDNVVIDCMVDWGDGSEIENVTAGKPTHVYADPDVYTVRITGTVTAIGSGNNANVYNYLTAIKQWGNLGLTHLRFAFQNCKNITSIPEDTTESFAEVESFYETFYGCSGLTEIPENLFKYATKATDFSYCFSSCTGLTSIPENLLANCVSAEEFYSTFNGLTGVTEIPEKLFANCTKATTFQQVFRACSALTTVPEKLFANCPEVENFQDVFSACSSLESLPALFTNHPKATNFQTAFQNCPKLTDIDPNLFSGCTGATTFTQVFQQCSTLVAIPTGLFDKCVSADTFKSAFGNCVLLETVPGGLFKNCTEVTSFSTMFQNCAALKSIPSDTFATCTKVTDFSSLFYNCNTLESGDWMYGLFANCTAVTKFGSLFYNCKSLTSIPADLIKNCTAVTDISSLCYFCSALEKIPDGLLDSCDNVTTLSGTFQYCSLLETIPEGLFDHCGKVTTLANLFNSCVALKEVREGLFDNCTAVTNISSLFKSCTALTSVPENLFSNCLKISSAGSAFSGCSELEQESPYDDIEIDGVKYRVHLYERTSDPYKSYYGVSSISHSSCFNSCSKLTDIDAIVAAGWGSK